MAHSIHPFAKRPARHYWQGLVAYLNLPANEYTAGSVANVLSQYELGEDFDKSQHQCVVLPLVKLTNQRPNELSGQTSDSDTGADYESN